MPATSKLAYSASTPITCTLNPAATGIGTNSARNSTVVDNTVNLFLDALVGVSVKTAAGSLATSPYVNVYAYAIVDGTNYTDQDRMASAGLDGAFTLGGSPLNVKLIGTVNLKTAATATYGGLFSVASAFGGSLPPKWGIVIENQSGLALDNSAPGAVSYYGVSLTSG
jgi:hypothetical protein